MDTRFTDPKAEHLWEHAQVGLAFVGSDGRWLRANPYLSSVLGYTDSELQARTFQQVTHPDDVEADTEMVAAVLDGRIPYYTMQKRYLTKVGTVVWIRLHVSKVTDEQGEFGMFLSQVRPIDAAEIRALGAAPVDLPPATIDDVTKWVRGNWKLLIGAGSILAAAAAKLMRWW